jgi:hypothetical protein
MKPDVASGLLRLGIGLDFPNAFDKRPSRLTKLSLVESERAIYGLTIIPFIHVLILTLQGIWTSTQGIL